MGSPAGGAKGAGAKGSGGSASPAALNDDEDIMARRRALFHNWKGTRKPKRMQNDMLIAYDKSPSPPVRRY